MIFIVLVMCLRDARVIESIILAFTYFYFYISAKIRHYKKILDQMYNRYSENDIKEKFH